VPDELVQLLSRLVRRRLRPANGGAYASAIDTPSSTFEALLQERLRAVEEDLSEIRGRVNGLIFLVVGAVLVQLLLRIAP